MNFTFSFHPHLGFIVAFSLFLSSNAWAQPVTVVSAPPIVAMQNAQLAVDSEQLAQDIQNWISFFKRKLEQFQQSNSMFKASIDSIRNIQNLQFEVRNHMLFDQDIRNTIESTSKTAPDIHHAVNAAFTVKSAINLLQHAAGFVLNYDQQGNPADVARDLLDLRGGGIFLEREQVFRNTAARRAKRAEIARKREEVSMTYRKANQTLSNAENIRNSADPQAAQNAALQNEISIANHDKLNEISSMMEDERDATRFAKEKSNQLTVDVYTAPLEILNYGKGRNAKPNNDLNIFQ